MIIISFRSFLNAFALAAFATFAASAAQAQTRTWVSGVGDDFNPCSRTAPCKTLAGALSKTSTGGEINVLDPGGFGAVTINKAITIDGLGITGGNLASGISGITVNITATNLANDKVIIRNLEINGNNSAGGHHGIRFLDGAELTVENVSISNFTGNGIHVAQTQMSRTNLRNVTTDNIAGAAVRAGTTASNTFIMVENSRLNATTDGILADGNAFVTVRDTSISNSTTGIRTNGATSRVHADDVLVTLCATAIKASASGIINLSDTTIAQNLTGLNANGGAINSFGGNSLIGNLSAGAFSSTTPKQ